jgi:transcriptional regulator with XRE-family HTH domain
VDAARLDLGLSKQELARISRVSRSTIADLINRGRVPGRNVTRERIEAALGWRAGSFEAVAGGGDPSLSEGAAYPRNGPMRVLVDQLRQISEEADAGATAAETLGKRLRVIGELAESAARLALRR